MTDNFSQYTQPELVAIAGHLTLHLLTEADPYAELDHDWPWPETVGLLSDEVQELIEEPTVENAKKLTSAVGYLKDLEPDPFEGLTDVSIDTDDRTRIEVSTELWTAWKVLAVRLCGQLSRAAKESNQARHAVNELVGEVGPNWRQLTDNAAITQPEG